MIKNRRSFCVLLFCIGILAVNLSECPTCAADGATPAVLSLLLFEKNIVEVTSDITTATTWKNTNIYVIRAWDFWVESTLVIEPGTIVKFHPDDGPWLTLGSGGRILADGTAAQPIVFTSYRDDVHGGDTNKDGGSTTPVDGDWYRINTNSEQDSVFDYCCFFYGGGGAYLSTLELFDSRATVTNCVFAHNKGGKSGDFYYGALDASQARVGTVITGNRFFDNIQPLSIGSNFDIDDTNIFHSEDGTQKNQYNGIFYNTTSDITRDLTWSETEVAFVIDDNDLWVDYGDCLTLGNNVVLKFMEGSELVLADGASALGNHDGAGVYFTSYKDDTRKGDTNGDLSGTSPATGDWVGIYDNTASFGGPYYFNWSNIIYDEIH